jgi:hypothetical protein
MSLPTKVHTTHAHQLLVYKRALHPELFQLRARRTINQGTYELEAWLMQNGHVMRFTHKGSCATELLIDREDNLPVTGVIMACPCVGENNEVPVSRLATVRYTPSWQTETLNDTLYATTFREMLELADETDAMVHTWASPETKLKNLSMLDVQRYGKEVHAQSYHMVASTGLVLRTQTIFEHE